MKNYGSFEQDCEIIVIHIKAFNLDRPIHFKNKVFIRKNGEDKSANHEEIEQLMNKIHELKYMNKNRVRKSS